jgi:CBS domain-containing protein
VTIADVSNLSGRDALVSIKETETIAVVLELLTKVQRVVVIAESNGSNQFVGVISQSTIASYLASIYGAPVTPRVDEALWPNGNKSLKELGLVKGSVISVSIDETVMYALYAMHTNSISS